MSVYCTNWFFCVSCSQKNKRMALKHPQRPLYMGMLHVIFFHLPYWFTISLSHSFEVYEQQVSASANFWVLWHRNRLCFIPSPQFEYHEKGWNKEHRKIIMRVFIKTCKCVLINIFKNIRSAKKLQKSALILLEFYLFGFISCKIR